MKDYYSILGVSEDADQKTIKKAYRKLALLWHPDKNPGDSAAEDKFKKASEAYDTLGNEEKRSLYDMQRSGQNINLNDFFGGSGVGDVFGGGLGDILERFGFGSRPSANPPTEKMVKFSIPLSELISGKSRRVFRIREEGECLGCHGVGGDTAQICHGCNGSGTTTKQFVGGGMTVNQTFPCELCYGRGKLISGICAACHGVGLIELENIYEVDITSKKR